MSDIFNPDSEDKNGLLGANDQNNIPENVLEELVGDGKKFKDVNELAKGKWEADQFIKRLEKEKAELNEDLSKRVSAAEVAEQIKALMDQQRSASNEPNNQRAGERDDDNVNTATMSEEEIQKILDDKLSQHQQKLSQEENLRTVRKELEKAWGPNFVHTLKEKVKTLGLGEDFANGFAATKPNAFLKLVMDQKKEVEDFQTPNQSSMRPSPLGTGKKYKDYQRMRQENPALYHSNKVQMEIYEEARRQGDDFYK